jgi:hypothetical protein
MQDQASQCQSETATRACVLDAGHDGKHFDDGITWDDPPAPVQTIHGDWQVTAQVHTVRNGWQSSRQVPTFTIPRLLAPTVADARTKVAEIINPYGDYGITFDLYVVDGNGETYRAFKQSAQSEGCVLCRRIGHPLDEPCLP